jgi:hypothetical protein
MMDIEQFLLCKIAEEAAELAQIALKAQQFGLSERYNNGPSNAERMAAEYTDLVACVAMLNVHLDGVKITATMAGMDQKAERVKEYAWYSASLGKIETPVPLFSTRNGAEPEKAPDKKPDSGVVGEVTEGLPGGTAPAFELHRMKTAVYPMPETKEIDFDTNYFFVSSAGTIGSAYWQDSGFDRGRLKAGNVFLKREHAQAKADAQAVEVSE